jgi:hypothetical protein
MIDGAKIVEAILAARKRGTGIVLSSESTAALASYMAHAVEHIDRCRDLQQRMQRVMATHSRYVQGDLLEYVDDATEALTRLREYVARVEEAKAKDELHQTST